MERGVQSKQKATKSSSPDQLINGTSSSNDNEQNSVDIRQSPSDPSATSLAPHLQLNLVYFNFWLTLFVVGTLVSMFWVDILPLIGTSSSLSDFGCK